MIIQSKAFRLRHPVDCQGIFCVDPAGLLEIDLVPQQRQLMAPFEQLIFVPHCGGTRVQRQGQHAWQVELEDQDAGRLIRMIRNAQDELETLMREL
ncbi:hypothetical protein [Ferrimonas pelagia]|uniref:PilZ domain-containing protein n=1 Tax=Ferrimonas pelagia TaxID=1177826 RepID=A0ABP9F3K9_9GAMM